MSFHLIASWRNTLASVQKWQLYALCDQVPDGSWLGQKWNRSDPWQRCSKLREQIREVGKHWLEYWRKKWKIIKLISEASQDFQS